MTRGYPDGSVTPHSIHRIAKSICLHSSSYQPTESTLLPPCGIITPISLAWGCSCAGYHHNQYRRDCTGALRTLRHLPCSHRFSCLPIGSARSHFSFFCLGGEAVSADSICFLLCLIRYLPLVPTAFVVVRAMCTYLLSYGMVACRNSTTVGSGGVGGTDGCCGYAERARDGNARLRTKPGATVPPASWRVSTASV